MVVIYAEKHSLAKDIANALNAGKRIPCKTDQRIGHWEFEFNGEKAVLIHGQGHLVQLAPSKAYGEQFEKWDINKYPCIPDTFILQIKEDTKTVFDYVKQFFLKADRLINATDPDREGELIFDYIYSKLKCNKPWERVWLTDLTKPKIIYAFNHLKDGSEMHGLQKAGEARAIADWLYGINLTVALSAKFSNGNGLLSCGRVQTPTLAMVVNREKEIQNFQKKPFFKVIGEFTCPAGKYTGEYSKGKLDDKASAELLIKSLSNNGVVKSKDIKQKSINAPLLFNSTQLQIVCAKELNWSLKKAESTMQKLYEAHYMSYPRTNTEHLTVAMQGEVAKTIEKLMNVEEFEKFKLDKDSWLDFSKRHFDDEKVGSHTAIIPTLNVPNSLSDIGDDDMIALYSILAKSLLRIVYPKVIIEDTKMITSVGDIEFVSTGSVIVNPGWYEVDAMPEKINNLPNISQGTAVSAKAEIKAGETKPPKRYTEPELINAMELAGQKLEDEEARTLLKMQKRGLGTDATRVATVQALYKREYIAKKGKTIVPTERGIYLIDTLPVKDIKSAELTGEIEKQLNDIELGKSDYDSFISMIKSKNREWYQQIANSKAKAYENKSMQCPVCDHRLCKGTKNIFCSDYKNGCKFRIPYELCGKKLTANQIAMLISSQRTNIIKGFVGKSGKTFDASLKIDNNGNLEFVFPAGKKRKKK